GRPAVCRTLCSEAVLRDWVDEDPMEGSPGSQRPFVQGIPPSCSSRSGSYLYQYVRCSATRADCVLACACPDRGGPPFCRIARLRLPDSWRQTTYPLRKPLNLWRSFWS